MMLSNGFKYSILSGSLAATASVFGKLSMSSTEAKRLYNLIINCLYLKTINTTEPNSHALTCLRIIMFILMVLTNTIMWTSFSKALSLSGTTIEATIINTSMNFFLTAIYGQVFFNEKLSLYWWFGATLITFGLVMMHQGIQSIDRIKDKKSN